MVHALKEAHRLLKPVGKLIDIHPVATPSVIEIHHGKQIDAVGNLMVRQWYVDFQQADQALKQVVEERLFTIEWEDEFESFTYYESSEEMHTAFIQEIQTFARDSASIAESKPIVEELSARANQLLRSAGNGAKLIRRERTHISRMNAAIIHPVKNRRSLCPPDNSHRGSQVSSQ